MDIMFLAEWEKLQCEIVLYLCLLIARHLCEKRIGKSKREDVGQDELTFLISQHHPKNKMHLRALLS